LDSLNSPRVIGILPSIACLALLGACASRQQIRIEGPDQIGPATSSVSVIDRRRPSDKEFHLQGRPHCIRFYGDRFVEPSTFEYLRAFILAKTTAAAPRQIEITRLETLEYCDGAVKRTRGLGLSAAIAGATGGKVLIPPDVPTDVSGDRFVLHITGTVDSTAFEVTRQFDYDDLEYLNYPKENPEYLARIRSSFAAAADEIVHRALPKD
jgi:hypothetical protein